MNTLSFLSSTVLRLWNAANNGRAVYRLVLSFALNFSPVFIWLCMFKNAGLVPKQWRPKINVPWAYNWDLELFALRWLPLWIFISLVVLFGWLYHMRSQPNYPLFGNNDIEDNTKQFNNKDVESFYQMLLTNGDTSSSSSSQDSLELDSSLVHQTSHDTPLRLKNRPSSQYLVPMLIFAIWPVLNIEHWFSTPLNVPRDLTAWLFYVLAHITFPILTAVWLYVFHVPGALKSFSIALGSQNIAGVITHMLCPTAPPWFIHMYGPEAPADYDMLGYAAGLTRVDMALGTHIHSNGFHKSPIVFGAVPSLHSAMAVQVCLFVLYFANSAILRALAVAFVCIQWWATMYLDHHFRIDLIIGCMYALVAFIVVSPYMRRCELRFIDAKRRGDEVKGTTMGMRVFVGFGKVRDFFDPSQ